MLKDEQIRMQEALSAGTVSGTLRDTYFVKLNEIDRLQKLMGPVQQMGNTATSEDMSGAQAVFDSKRKNPINRQNNSVNNPQLDTAVMESLRPKRRPPNFTLGN